MKKMHRLFWLLAVTVAFTGCKKVSSRQDLDKIHALEIKADEGRRMTKKGWDPNADFIELGKAYGQFANNYPNAPETPEFLFRAGELYSNELQDPQKAIEMFQLNHERYPEHETAGNALFFVAYLYNNSLHDLAKAEKYYKEFLDKYPDHKLATSAKFELESLGMPVDDVFEHLVTPDSAESASPTNP